VRFVELARASLAVGATAARSTKVTVLAEALRARATGAGRVGPGGSAPRGGPDSAAVRTARCTALSW